MQQSVDEIIRDIRAHITKEGSPFSDWYVGITSNINDRVFGDHNVSEKDQLYIYCEAYTVAFARHIEQQFIDVDGTDGGPGGGDEDSVFVYAYKKTSETNP